MDGPPPALPATVRWSSSAPWWTPCVALSKSRTPWSSATRAPAGRGRRERVERTRTFGRLPFRQLPARASLTVRLGQSGGRLSWRRHRHARNRLSQTEPGPRRSGGVRDPPADAGEPRTSETMNSALCPTSTPASYPVLAVSQPHLISSARTKPFTLRFLVVDRHGQVANRLLSRRSCGYQMRMTNVVAASRTA